MPPALFAITGIPILLTGAAVVGLPVLLHLIMKQEPKRLPFPAFRFLKQKRQLNQRKIRLRHLLLLLLRMGLIALICLSLWQPTVLSEGFSLRGGRPVAAILVIDTSPSMGYVLAERTGLSEARQRGLKLLQEPADGPWTCLDEARGRAMEILEDMPAGSKVAIVDTSDRGDPVFETGVAEARQRVRDLKRTRGNSRSITQAVERSYILLGRVDSEMEPGQEPMPRLLAVFSDRTSSSWDANRTAELQSLRDRVPPPSVHHLYLDVGVDKPVNAAIVGIDMRPQIVPANQPIVVNVTVESVGGSVDDILLFSVDGEPPQRTPVNPGPNRPVTTTFRKAGLKPGLHTAKVSLLTADALPFDGERTLAFRIREPRKVLAIVDTPPASIWTGGLGSAGVAEAQAQVWRGSLASVGWYDCDVVSLDNLDRIDWPKYEQVTLLDLRSPPPALWTRVADYVKGGGHLVVTPGGADMEVDAYRTANAERVLPRKFTRWNAVPPREAGPTWTWSALDPQRPLLSIFRAYREQNAFFETTPPTIISGFWQVEPGARDRVVVPYNDAASPDQRSPAVLEGGIGPRGRVYQFTVPLGLGSERVHNYASSWFYLVLANEAVRTLAGDSEDQSFNFATGQNVLVKWPAGDAKPGATYYLSGPDVTPNESTVKREEGQAYFRLGPERTGSTGMFTLSSEDGKWSDGFSLNVPAEESNLDRVPVEAINELFGADAVSPADKKLPLDEILSGRFTQPIELFPFLMILLLLVLAIENWMGNRFYRRKPTASGRGA